MLFAPLPVPIPFPIHVVDPPGMAGWLIAVISGAVGFVLAIIAEPIKSHILELVATRKLKPILYAELARYFVSLEIAWESEKPDRFTNLASTPPQFGVMDWYSAHNLNLILRIDPKGELMRIESILKGLQEAFHKQFDEDTTGTVLLVVAKNLTEAIATTGGLDLKLLDKARVADREERERRKRLAEKMNLDHFSV
jgi:hypothetical protein